MSRLLTLVSRRGEPSRRIRRVTAIVALAAIPPFIFVLKLTEDWPAPASLLTFVGTLTGISLPLLVLSEFRRNVIRRGNADERERRRRDEAYRLSYRILEFSVVLVPLAVTLSRGQLGAIAPRDWILWWMTVWGWVVFLPYAVFWREPDAAA